MAGAAEKDLPSAVERFCDSTERKPVVLTRTRSKSKEGFKNGEDKFELNSEMNGEPVNAGDVAAILGGVA